MRRRLHPNKKFSDVLSTYFLIFLILLNLIPCQSAPASAADTIIDDPKTELTFSVVESKAPIAKANAVPSTPAQDLSPQRVEELLKRLSPLNTVTKKAFVIPEDSLVKPKLPGIQTLEEFPPKETEREKPVVAAAKTPPSVLRVSHSGIVDTVTQYAITFSQPMVAVSEARTFPTVPCVVMKPQPAGKYKWAGTQTLLFDPERGRFPKSTEYNITVPAGTESANGGQSAKEQSWIMTTPTLVCKAFYPQSGPQVQSPLMVAVFDQDIDRKAVLKNMRMSVGKEDFAVRLVDDAVVEKDASHKYWVQNLPKNQWLAFEPETPLPLGTQAKVSFLPGCPSLEGPMKTTKAQDFRVDIHGSLKLVRSPGEGVSPERWAYRSFEFSNPIDSSNAKFKKSMVKVTPSAEVEVQVSGSNISILGRLKPYTKYTVTFDKEITDSFGQTLEREVVGTFTTGALNTQISRLETLSTIPYGQKPVLSVFAQATPQVKATIYRATPSDWLIFSRDRYNKNLHVGSAVGSKTFQVGDEEASFDIDLKPYLKNGLGQFIIEVETVGAPKNRDQRFSSWVQVTKLGIDAFKGRNLVALATSLSDGEPLSGINLTLLNSDVTGVTDSSGLAKLAISNSWDKSEILVARRGDDIAILPASQYRSGWVYMERPSQLLWYAVTDRQLYKPGEKVTVKGWARGLYFKPNDALQIFTPKIDTVSYTISSYDGKELVKGDADVDANGGFSFETDIPAKVNLGNASIVITAHSKQTSTYPGSQFDLDLVHYFGSGSLTTNVPIKIQEFRRPEFEMKVASSLGNTMLIGDTTSLTAKTQYYAGGILQDAPIAWSVAASETSYSPPGWSEFTFGKVLPFWSRAEGFYIGRGGRGGTAVSEVKTLSSTTDASGANTVNVKFDSFREPFPMSCSCEATVNDVNRQAWSDKISILVHSADRYVGVKPGKWFYHKGEPVDLRLIATDIDGKVMPGSRVVVKLMRIDREGKEVEVVRQTVSSGEHAQLINLMPKEGGQHYVIATVFDGKERRNCTRISTWVEGDTPAEARKAQLQTLVIIPDHKEYQPGDVAEIMVSSSFYPAHGVVTVRRNSIVSTIPLDMPTSSKSIKIPVTKDYYPNFSVEAYLTGKDANFASGTVELKVPPRARTLTLKAVAEERQLSPGGDTTVKVELKGADGRPVKNAQVALAVADEAVLALAGYKWPDPIDVFYPAAQSVVENAYSRQYVILPTKKADEISEQLKQKADRPSQAMASPMSRSAVGGARGQYNEAGKGMADARSMDKMIYGDEGASGPAGPEPNIVVRTNFNALALFVPSLMTDENGKAKAKLHLPDSLTRYRIMAVAVSGDDMFGSTESNVTARLPLMVKPSAPRFLHFGDRCELPVVLQNQTDKPLKVEVVIRAANAKLKDVSKNRSYDRLPPPSYHNDPLKGGSDPNSATDEKTASKPANRTSEASQSEPLESAGKVVEVPANDRVEVRFPVATIDEGSANFQCAAVSGAISDAAEFSIPVLVPATMETFATYGQIDKGAIQQKLDRPKDIFEQVGGLTITTSSTAVQALTDAYFYLKNYNFGCSEQISSRMIAMLSLQDVLVSFGKLDGDAQTKFREFVKKDIDQLVKRQNPDGSFGLWKTEERDRWPYVSIQVAQALNLATQKDYVVDKQILDRSEHYLKNIADHIPKEYGERTKIAIEARALNVRFRMKDSDPSAARHLIRRALNPPTKKQSSKNPPKELSEIASDRVSSDLSLECAGWLLPIMSKDQDSSDEVTLIRKQFDATIKETASTASANDGGYGDWNYCVFYSPRRTDAIVLEALMADQPESELIPKMVKGLLAHRKNGTWEGTQENGYILQALDQYFGTYEKQKPDFESQAWLGETLVGLQKFVGRTTETKILSIPTSYLARRSDSDIVINKVGPGRLYYRIGLDYAPRNLTLKPADFGFSVEREYEAVDNKDDVKKDADGIWHIKAGSTVKTKLKFSTPGARYHVALMDPLPAGAEPLNPDLSGSRTQVPENGTSAPSGGKFHIQTRSISLDQSSYCWWWPRTWFEHQNLRDHQAEAFQSLLFAGNYDYSYMIRATTPGDYNVPPTKLEEMYMSETFGRCASDHVIIE